MADRGAAQRATDLKERPMSDSIRDNAAQSRFEMDVDGETAFITYRRGSDAVDLLHAEVPSHLEGHGHGARLVRGVLDHLRAEGAKVRPSCSFVVAYMRRHKDVQDLLAD